MSYQLLDKAPKDHKSDDFLQFLRSKNQVIEETKRWLIIANCRYDKPERRWYTAFFKDLSSDNSLVNLPHSEIYLLSNYKHLNWLIKAPKDRSVKRFHVHLYE